MQSCYPHNSLKSVRINSKMAESKGMFILKSILGFFFFFFLEFDLNDLISGEKTDANIKILFPLVNDSSGHFGSLCKLSMSKRVFEFLISIAYQTIANRQLDLERLSSQIA